MKYYCRKHKDPAEGAARELRTDRTCGNINKWKPREAVVELKLNVTVYTCGRNDVHVTLKIAANTGLLCVIRPSLYVEQLTRLKANFPLYVISQFYQQMKVEN
jgi:hypothetical protein